MSLKNRTGRLSLNEYTQACALTQINSIDLLVQNEKGEFLVGLRKNPPAKGSYFVPGGRVYKQETLLCGFIRTMKEELGYELDNIDFYGTFEHYYEEDNPTDEKNIDTHYIVHAFTGTLPKNLDTEQFLHQHSDMLWLSKENLLSHDNVHIHTKRYFSKDSENSLNSSLSIYCQQKNEAARHSVSGQ